MILKIKKIRPLFNQLVVTKHIYTMEEARKGNVYTGMANKIKEYQQVLAVGPMVKGIEKGDFVFINPARYVKLDHKDGQTDAGSNITKDDVHATVNIPTYTLYTDEGSMEVMLIYDNDVHLCVPELEEFDESPLIVKPDGFTQLPPLNGGKKN